MAARDKLCKVFVFAYPRSCLDNYFEKKHGYYPNFNSIVYLFIYAMYLFNPREAREELFRKLSETRKIKNRSGEFNSSKPGNLFKKRENDRDNEGFPTGLSCNFNTLSF